MMRDRWREKFLGYSFFFSFWGFSFFSLCFDFVNFLSFFLDMVIYKFFYDLNLVKLDFSYLKLKGINFCYLFFKCFVSEYLYKFYKIMVIFLVYFL